MEPMNLSLPKRRRVDDPTQSTTQTDEGQLICDWCSTASDAGTLPSVQVLCITCEKYLCDICMTRHNDFYRDHLLIERTNVDTAQVSQLIQTLASQTILDDIMITKFQQKKMINAKHVRDSNICWISGCTVLNDGRLALVDHDNNSLKIINIDSHDIEKYFKSEKPPWDVAELDPDTVAVTFPELQSIVIISLKEDVRVLSQINVKIDCHGIDYTNDNFFVSSTAPPVVQILDKTGQLLRQFEKNDTGGPLFEWPLYLAVGPETDRILVSDYFNDKVVCIRLDSELLREHEYRHEKLKYPRGMVYDGGGSVFLAGRYNIHQMTTYCDHVQVPLQTKDGIEFAQCLAYNKKRNLLFVGKYRANTMSNWISVFYVE